MRLVEIRLLEGPNLYRLEPAVKVEVAVGAEEAWHGERDAVEGVATRLWANVPPSRRPAEVARLAGWCGRLRVEAGKGPAADVHVHRGADPGHWIVSFPWRGAERARTLAEAAWQLAGEAHLDPESVSSDHPDVVAAEGRISGASAHGPTMIRDVDRRIPVVSISGTNGKSTVARMIAHVLGRAGRRVGLTTSDGIIVGGRMVEPGDWTGPGGAAAILGRGDIDVAVLETARGGILLRGVGYESNEASVLTNVSSDHLDLQGIHTLPELTAAKATICRITRPDGWVVLNADDPHVAAVASLVAAPVAFFSLEAELPPVPRAHVERGGRAYVVRRGTIIEVEAGETRPIVAVDEIPVALRGLARHNVANALAAAGGARALGATLAQVADGLRDFRPSAERSPGRLNLYRHGKRVVIVDYAHNEAGLEALLDVANGVAAGGAARTWPVTMIIGTAGDRPDDAIRGIGRIAAKRAQRVVIKETPSYLRGRDGREVIDVLRAGIAEGAAEVAAAGRPGTVDPATVPVHQTEVAALRAELALAGGPDPRGQPDQPAVVAIMCHAERDDVFRLLADLGARPVDTTADLQALVPRLTPRPRRG
ncbi:MAG: Mur ligase family protein [Chloroflexota bacterium]